MLTFRDSRPGLFRKRREFLHVGSGLAVSGWTLAGLVSPAAAASSPDPAPAPATGGAKSCILVYLPGGPPHQDLSSVSSLCCTRLKVALTGCGRCLPVDVQSRPADSASSILDAPVSRQVRTVLEGNRRREAKLKCVQFINARLNRV